MVVVFRNGSIRTILDLDGSFGSERRIFWRDVSAAWTVAGVRRLPVRGFVSVNVIAGRRTAAAVWEITIAAFSPLSTIISNVTPNDEKKKEMNMILCYLTSVGRLPLVSKSFWISALMIRPATIIPSTCISSLYFTRPKAGLSVLLTARAAPTWPPTNCKPWPSIQGVKQRIYNTTHMLIQS